METSKKFEGRWLRILACTNAKSDSALARILDILPQSVTAARKRGQIPTGWIENISEKFNVSTDWLFFGRGPMRPSDLTEQPMTATRIAAPAAPDPSPLAVCPRCAELEEELKSERKERRELAAENRQLWKENSECRERLARYEERAIKPDMEDADPRDRPLA